LGWCFVGAGSYLLASHSALDGATQWFNGTIAEGAAAVQWANIWLNLCVWTTSMSGVLWSIQVELFAAPFIPLMFWLSGRVSWIIDIAILAALALLTKYLVVSEARAASPQIGFLAYLVCFYLGVALPKPLANAALAPALRSPILAIAACLLSLVALRFAGDLPTYVIATTLISGAGGFCGDEPRQVPVHAAAGPARRHFLQLLRACNPDHDGRGARPATYAAAGFSVF
jgi:hypothetical protein